MEQKIETCSWHFIDTVCNVIVGFLPDNQYKCVYGIPRGGLVPSVLLSHRLDLPMITSTNDLNLYGVDEVLIVDDIVDSGNTIETYANYYDTAALFWRKHTAKVRPTYFGMMLKSDVWIQFPWETQTKDNVSQVNRGA